MKTTTMQHSSASFANKRRWRVKRKYSYDKVTGFLIVFKRFSLCKAQQDQDEDPNNDIESQDEDDQGLGRTAQGRFTSAVSFTFTNDIIVIFSLLDLGCRWLKEAASHSK